MRPVPPPTRRWIDQPTTAFGSGAVDWIAVLPLAAVEQHGPHVPTGVDLKFAEALVDQVVATLPSHSRAVFLPSMAVGKSDEHHSFRGTLALSWDTTVRWLLDFGTGVRRAGPRLLAMVTSHGGSGSAMEIAARELRGTWGLRVVTTAWADCATPPVCTIPPLRPSTFMQMSALRPNLMRVDAARDFVSAQADLAVRNVHLSYHGAQANMAWLAEDLNANRPVGNSASACKDQGTGDLRRMAAGFVDLLAEVGALPPLHEGKDCMI